MAGGMPTFATVSLSPNLSREMAVDRHSPLLSNHWSWASGPRRVNRPHGVPHHERKNPCLRRDSLDEHRCLIRSFIIRETPLQIAAFHF